MPSQDASRRADHCHYLGPGSRRGGTLPQSQTDRELLRIMRTEDSSASKAKRALILSSGPEIGPEDFLLTSSTSPSSSPAAFPAWIDSLPESVSLRELLEDVEKGLILRALNSSSSVQAEAARRLQLSRSDLSYKLTKFNIKPGA